MNKEKNGQLNRPGTGRRAFRHLSGYFSLAGVLMFLGGVVVWGGFNWAMDSTNSMEFCISCHEMHDNIYVDYRETIHFKNRSGVQASCGDCHVPREWGPKVARKIYASNELFHSWMGTVDTPEKFEANRLEMAERVWKSMRASDSRECRNCHDYSAMDPEQQDRMSVRRHDAKRLEESGETCIDCHQGIAHRLPADY